MSEKRVFIDVQFCANEEINPRHCTKMLYDTGANVSLMNRETFEKLKTTCPSALPRFRPIRAEDQVSNASGEPMGMLGIAQVRFKIAGKEMTAPFYVTTEDSDNIIGMNIIKYYVMGFDVLTGRIKFGHAKALPQGKYMAIARREAVLQPRTAQKVTCSIVDSQTKEPLRQAVEVIAHMDLLSVAATSDEHGNFTVHLPNNADSEKIFPRGTQLGVIEPLHDWTIMDTEEILSDGRVHAISRRRPHTEADKKVIFEGLAASINNSVPYQYQQEYFERLTALHDNFSADSLDLGFSNLISHEINVKDNNPTYRQQFRLAHDHLQFIKDNVMGWLKAGIIEKSRSPYNAPLFCVPKKTGQGLRAVLDYRYLNANSLDDKYSIRTIDECLEAVGREGSSVFSCLDLTNGYWQMELRESDRPYTAFTLPGIGQFQWVTTAQGLMGAPASFSRLIDKIMEHARNAITYMDDVLIHSRCHKSHLEFLTSAIYKLGAAGLRLNPRKCVFGAAEVEYLGHTISGAGVRPGTDKTKALEQTPPPTDVKQLKAFLGLANYFRSYVKDFATKATPLYQLTRNDSEWKAGTLPTAAMEAYTSLKTEICTRPVLAYPNATGQFHLYVDASLGDENHEGGLGAVLEQDQPDGSKRPVAYASRRLIKHEKNYPAFLAEMQAAVYGMETFRHFLMNRNRFNLYTDHKPLCALSKVHTKTLNRLQLKLLEMNPRLVHVNGSENTLADFLSRSFWNEKPAVSAVIAPPSSYAQAVVQGTKPRISMIPLDEATISVAQQQDDNCEQVMSYWQSLDEEAKKGRFCFKPPGSTRQYTFLVDRGLLYVQMPIRTGFVVHASEFRILAPASLHSTLIDLAHASQYGGHAGIFKTGERIREKFFWPHMDKAVLDRLKSCQVCQTITNKATQKVTATQPLPECTAPLQRVHIDLFGSLKSNNNSALTPSRNGNHFVLVITDAFTKIVQLVPLPDKAAKTVTEALLHRFIYVFGVPQNIHSDQGNEFTAQFQQILFDSLGIDRSTTSPYHPRCNGQAEIFNKTMAHYLATAILEAEKSTLDWEDYLSPLQFSYNTAVHSTIKQSPFRVHFGYDPRVPLWEGFALPGEEDLQGTGDLAEYLLRLRKAQITARRIAHHNSQAQRQNMATDDAEIEMPEFKAGDKVYIRINQKNWPNPKLGPKWERGVVVDRLSLATYRVIPTDRKRKRQRTVNIQQLKPRVDRDEEEEDNTEQEEEDEEDNAPTTSFDDEEMDIDQESPQSEEEEDEVTSEPEEASPPTTRYNLRQRKTKVSALSKRLVVANISEMGPATIIKFLRMGAVMISPEMATNIMPLLQDDRASTSTAATPQQPMQTPTTSPQRSTPASDKYARILQRGKQVLRNLNKSADELQQFQTQSRTALQQLDQSDSDSTPFTTPNTSPRAAHMALLETGLVRDAAVRHATFLEQLQQCISPQSPDTPPRPMSNELRRLQDFNTSGYRDHAPATSVSRPSIAKPQQRSAPTASQATPSRTTRSSFNRFNKTTPETPQRPSNGRTAPAPPRWK
jgi:predicted aspartyl protease